MDILTTIAEQRKAAVKRAQKIIPQEQLKELCQARSDFRPFSQSLDEQGIRIIAEIKQASPSRGVLVNNLNVVQVAREYETGGAAAISVLTEPHFFRGSLAYLRSVRSAVALPILQKDFIVSDYQLYEGSFAGADAVLLITRMLSQRDLLHLYALALELRLVPVVEIFDQTELPVIKQLLEHSLIGINNRDLQTFQTNPLHAVRLVDSVLEQGKRPIVFSGIGKSDDLQPYVKRTNRFLIGEYLVTAKNRSSSLRELLV